MPALEAAERLKTAGRNDDCPCGSTKKYKKCHLRADEEAVSKQMAEAQTKADSTAAKEAEAADTEAVAAGRPKAAQSAGKTSIPKAPMSHKPMSAPRKAGAA